MSIASDSLPATNRERGAAIDDKAPFANGPDGRPNGRVRRRQRHEYLAIATGLFLAFGVAWGGFNSNMGVLLAALGNITLLLAFLITIPQDRRLIRHVGFVFAIVTIAFLWLAIIHLGIAIIPWTTPADTLAPDMFGHGFAAIAGWLSLLILGAGIGGNSNDGELALKSFLLPTVTLLLAALGLRTLGLFDEIAIWELSWQGRFAGPLGNANATAALSGCMAMLILGQILNDAIRANGSAGLSHAKLTLRSILLFVSLLIAFVSLAATASRFAVIITIVFALMLVWRARRLGITKSTVRNRIFMGVLVSVPVWLVASQSGLLADRFAMLSGGGSDRLNMWGHYIDLVWQSPFYGYGPGSFSMLNQQALTSLDLANALWRVNSPHNILLQVALVGGLPYLAFIAMAVIVICKGIGRDLSGRNWPLDRLGLVAGLAVILACSLVDIVLDVPAIISLFVFGIGLLWQPSAAFERLRD